MTVIVVDVVVVMRKEGEGFFFSLVFSSTLNLTHISKLLGKAAKQLTRQAALLKTKETNSPHPKALSIYSF